MLKKHAKLAESLGMKPGNILIADIGDTAVVTPKSIKRGERFSSGTRLVDGLGIDDGESVVLRDRIHLSEDGIIIVVACIDELSGHLVSTDLVNKGIVMDEAIWSEAKNNVSNALAHLDVKADGDKSEIKYAIRRSLKNYIFKKTKKNPMILPVIMEV